MTVQFLVGREVVMEHPEKYDRRPRVSTYNEAVFEYLSILRGPEAAKSGLEQMIAAQRERGLTPIMRFPKDSDRMCGYPVIDLSPRCREMAERSADIPWFANTLNPLSDPNV